MKDKVFCAFCGQWFPQSNAVEIVIYPLPKKKESQAVYCHRSCLAARLHPELPRHPALDEPD